ncbi:hypothetical protein PVK06_039772 [Gossypium arboreum]|uniref:Retrovirus-related Pol polyprotein from transposon TNT 1-94 n=1 Tax=Gossypium arboreum TaxID=29729 RepID=A0ABR0N3S1_GOSAR|nr:hypothetical protein PVK06_039772 [Gossypium arboreum]
MTSMLTTPIVDIVIQQGKYVKERVVVVVRIGSPQRDRESKVIKSESKESAKGKSKLTTCRLGILGESMLSSSILEVFVGEGLISAHSNMAATRFEIEKFDGKTNFNLWQVRIMAILIQSSLKKVVTRKKLENLNKTEWEELDEKALSAIQLCLANMVLQEVLMEKTSFALWKRLETLYGTKSLANRLVPKQFTFCMNEGELLRDHISQFITLLNDLKYGEAHIDDENQLMLLSCSLPPSYKSFRETQIYGKDKLSFEDVKGHLLSKDKLDNELHLDSKANRQASVLIASKKRDKRCRYCKRYVPDLRKNLISLSILDLKGCKINIKSSSIKLSRGALALLKGKRIDSLYILEGSIVTGEIGRPSSVIESKSTCLE